MSNQSHLVNSSILVACTGWAEQRETGQTYWLLIVVKVATGLLGLCLRTKVYLLVCFSIDTNVLASRQPEKRSAKGEWCRHWEARMTCASLSIWIHDVSCLQNCPPAIHNCATRWMSYKSIFSL